MRTMLTLPRSFTRPAFSATTSQFTQQIFQPTTALFSRSFHASPQRSDLKEFFIGQQQSPVGM